MKTKAPRPFLSLQEGMFRLGDRLVFPSTTWTFRTDEQWAIIGANGSGKSLLADGLRGRLPLVRGELLYHFRPPAGLSPEEAIGHVAFEDRKREVHGAVVQSRWNSLEDLEALRVREFLSYDRVMEVNPFEVTGGQSDARRQFGRRRRRVAELLDLERLLGRTVLSLSNGERQRVELARALCRPLRMLILDEPFAGLDTAMRAQLQRILARLMATPLRVLLITTRPEDLPRQITHVMRVGNCRVAGTGKRREMVGTAAEGPRRSRDHGFLRAAECLHVAVAGDSHAPGELIRLNRVTVRYGKRQILRDVSWTVRSGES